MQTFFTEIQHQLQCLNCTEITGIDRYGNLKTSPPTNRRPT